MREKKQKEPVKKGMYKKGYTLTANDVAQQLCISVKTLTNWYKWYNDPKYPKPIDMPKLPEFHQCNRQARRFWKESSIIELKKFKEWVPHGRGGVMGELNMQYWSRYRKEWKVKNAER